MAHMYETSDFRNNLKVEIDGQPYVMTYFQFVKPGKGQAFNRVKLRNLNTGRVWERTFKSGESLEGADVNAEVPCSHWTPLLWASCNGNLDCVKLALAKLAALHGRDDVRRLL